MLFSTACDENELSCNLGILLMIFAGLSLLFWEVSSNAHSLLLPAFLSDVLHHDLLTPTQISNTAL